MVGICPMDNTKNRVDFIDALVNTGFVGELLIRNDTKVIYSLQLCKLLLMLASWNLIVYRAL